MNRYQIIGNLGSDAEVRTFESGMAAISFSVAVTEKWKDATGQKKERTDWIRCTIWRKSGQTSVADYLKKGTKVMVEGRPSARGWCNEGTGEVKAMIELRVDDFEFLSAVQRAGSLAAGGQSPEEMFRDKPPTNLAVNADVAKKKYEASIHKNNSDSDTPTWMLPNDNQETDDLPF